MKAHSRDKMALFIFFGMVALALSCLVGYLMIGHNWNVAASNIDDVAGSMEDYITIVYDGTLETVGAKVNSASNAIDIDDVAQSYREKNSSVFKLDTAHLSIYENALILRKGTKRIAVFSVLETDTAFKIERKVINLRKYKVDYIVAIAPATSLVESVSGVDIVIFNIAKEGLSVMGETIGDTFYVSAPRLGVVGAIIISPSGVVSAKVLSDI